MSHVDPAPYAAVLAGGSGTRFWPASRRAVPKQMLPLLGDEPLLRTTVRRLFPLVPPERILVVTATEQRADVCALLPELPPSNVLAEPRPRNTAAACALAAIEVARRAPDAPLLTLAADHIIRPDADLLATLAAATRWVAEHDSLLTLGLQPTRPATGYGWIELGKEAGSVGEDEGARVIRRVASFREKPDLPTAERYLASGRYLWNIALFAWRPSVLLAEMDAHLPEVSEPLRAIASRLGGPEQDAAIAAAYDEVRAISIDHGVLEHSTRIDCLPCSFDWDDVGSFAAIARHVAPDASGNVSHGGVLALDTERCITWADGDGLVALLGVEDLIVVQAGGVTLVAPRARAEEVKRLAGELGASGLERFE